MKNFRIFIEVENDKGDYRSDSITIKADDFSNAYFRALDLISVIFSDDFNYTISTIKLV